MALNYLLSPEFQISVTSGKPNTGGWIEVFIHGSHTKYFTACDFNGTKNPFRIPLDSLGQAMVLADDSNNYDVFVYNRYGTLLFSRYNVMPSGGGGGEPADKTRCVHRLLRYYTNLEDASEEHPAGDWLHDLDAEDPEDPSGHPLVTADQLFYWYGLGQIFDLYEVDSQDGQLGWSAVYRMVTWQDQSDWWSQFAPVPGKACRLEFFRMGMYSTPYRGGLIAYIRYKEEDYMRLYEIHSGQSVWMAEYQEKLPYYAPNVHNGDYLKVKDDGSDLEWSTISVPEYTAGTDVKISNQNVISSLHGLKSYSRAQQPSGDMVEDDLVSGVYHICPPTIVDNVKKNNLVYEYKVTDITNCAWLDLPYSMNPDADGFVPNLHYIIDLTGEITDDSNPVLIPGTHDSLTLSVGYGSTKAQLANYSSRYIPIYIGHKYLVDFYGSVAHVSVLGENRVQDIATNWGDVQESISTDPNTTHYNISYKLESLTVYHMDLYTGGLQAENTDKYMYRIALGAHGNQNIRYLTGWIRQDSGKSIQTHLDFTSADFTSMFIEFDQANYPMSTQTVNLTIMGTKEKM